MDYVALKDTVLKLKERIIKTETGDTQGMSRRMLNLG